MFRTRKTSCARLTRVSPYCHGRAKLFNVVLPCRASLVYLMNNIEAGIRLAFVNRAAPTTFEHEQLIKAICASRTRTGPAGCVGVDQSGRVTWQVPTVHLPRRSQRGKWRAVPGARLHHFGERRLVQIIKGPTVRMPSNRDAHAHRTAIYISCQSVNQIDRMRADCETGRLCLYCPIKLGVYLQLTSVPGLCLVTSGDSDLERSIPANLGWRDRRGSVITVCVGHSQADLLTRTVSTPIRNCHLDLICLSRRDTVGHSVCGIGIARNVGITSNHAAYCDGRFAGARRRPAVRAATAITATRAAVLSRWRTRLAAASDWHRLSLCTFRQHMLHILSGFGIELFSPLSGVGKSLLV